MLKQGYRKSDMLQCSKCGEDLDQEGKERWVASISGSIMGDEYTDSYYFCETCEAYTVKVFHDRFLGEEDVSVRGPIPKSVGDAKIELIRQCSEPWNKKCRCEAHRSYFEGWLD